MAQVGSHNESRTGSAAASSPTRLYPVYDADTDLLGWDDAGPATAALVYDDATDLVTVSDDPDAADALRVIALNNTANFST